MQDGCRDQGVMQQALVFTGPIEELVAGFDRLGKSLAERGSDPCDCGEEDCGGRVLKDERAVSAASNCHALCMIFEQARDVEARTEALRNVLKMADDERNRIGKAMEMQISTLMRYIEDEGIDLGDYLPVARVTKPQAAPEKRPEEALQ